MKRRYGILIGTLVACLLAAALVRASAGNAGGVGAPAAPTPQPLTTAQAANLDEHRAFEATLEARERAGALRAPTSDPRTRKTPPVSCPRAVSAQSVITAPQTQDPTARDVHIVTQATVVVGRDEYFISSGALKDNARQGVLVVTRFATDPCAATDPGTTVFHYAMPIAHGAITMTGMSGTAIKFTTDDGTAGTFDLLATLFQ